MTQELVAVPLARWPDPDAVHSLLCEESDTTFWLDAGPRASEGWSWVGDGHVEGDASRVRAVACAAPGDADEDSGRLRGGWVGWAGYEGAARRAGAPRAASDSRVPEELWICVERFVAFDHGRRRAWVFAPPGEHAHLAARIAEASAPPPPSEPAPVHVRARHEPGEYARLIEQCRAAIREGDAYQLCLTTRFSTSSPSDPVEVYRRLRAATPAHHGGLIVAGDVALASASPERFLDVAAGVVRTRPIKGTRPRGADEHHDAELADELRASEKERAENVMIVDLMRNDLSRVCVPGSVRVDALLEVETYPAVHQLVSTVAGDLAPGTDVGDLLDATFPAGSMTGAPKLSAMTILHRLEAGPRGVFAGAFGWIGVDGALDLAMVIRSIVLHPEGSYVGAGGGITWRSDADAEVAEVGVKARGPLGALGGRLPDGW